MGRATASSDKLTFPRASASKPPKLVPVSCTPSFPDFLAVEGVTWVILGA
jgi:hypothetical protein